LSRVRLGLRERKRDENKGILYLVLLREGEQKQVRRQWEELVGDRIKEYMLLLIVIRLTWASASVSLEAQEALFIWSND
jgi:hypothetical protein